MSRFYRRKEVFIIFFHGGSKHKESEKFRDDYVTLAEKLYGIARVGAINCKKETELCEEEFNIF